MKNIGVKGKQVWESRTVKSGGSLHSGIYSPSILGEVRGPLWTSVSLSVKSGEMEQTTSGGSSSPNPYAFQNMPQPGRQSSR